MRTFAELVPSLGNEFPRGIAAGAEFDPERIADVNQLIDLCEEAMRRAATLEAQTEIALRLLSQLSVLPAGSHPGVQLPSFFSGLCVADTAVRSGNLAVAHEWLLRALGVDYTGDATYDVDMGRLLLFRRIEDSGLRVEAAATAANWMHALFLHSSRSGDHQELARHVFRESDWLLGDSEFRSSIPRPDLVELTGQRGYWATRYQPTSAGSSIELIRPLAEGTDASAARAKLHLIALLCAVDPGPEAEGALLAQHALETEGLAASAVDLFQLAVFASGADPDKLRGRLDFLLAALEGVRAGRDERTKAHRLYAAGQSFQMLGPSVALLAAAGYVKDAVRLATAWTRDPGSMSVVEDPLICVLGYPGGAQWAMEEDVLGPSDHNVTAFEQVVSAMNLFMKTTVVVRESDGVVVSPAGEVGDTNPEHGDDFAAAISRHLRSADLNDLARKPTGLVVLPGLPIPIQANLVKEIGWTPTLNVSLGEPTESRPARRAVLLGDDQALTSQWELDVVEERFAEAGVDVLRQVSTITNFESAYSDPEVDLLWLASHARFDHYQPQDSKLQLNTNESLDLDALAALTVPTTGQRLLVLNTCDSGMSATLGGLLGYGLGPALVGPSQAVIANLWPTYELTAAVFGIELASHWSVPGLTPT